MSKPKNGPCAVYRMFAADGHLLYIGASTNLLVRVKDHERLKPWFKTVAAVTLVWFPTGDEARAAEKLAIATEQPEWNIYDHPAPPHKVLSYFQSSEWHQRLRAQRIVKAQEAS